ncbi:MAG: DUF952 domain-containing protein [Bdellovibrio sp.]|nr:MAG: DUF952 domain-containing protein [Bdellovibrio sp.]
MVGISWMRFLQFALLHLALSTAFAEKVPMATLFHIVSRTDWKTHSDGKSYVPSSLTKEGYIHLSTNEQVLGTANRFFKGQNDLLLLELSIPADDPKLKFESTEGDKNDRSSFFPHYYGKLKINSVRRILILEPSPDGNFAFPSKNYEP